MSSPPDMGLLLAALRAARSSGITGAPGSRRMPNWTVGTSLASGKYYTQPPVGSTISSAAALTANQLVYQPWVAPATYTIQGMALYNTSAAQTGRKFRMGIYSSSGGVPSALVTDFGETILPAAAGLNVKTGTATVSQGQLYFLAIAADGALNCNMYTPVTGQHNWGDLPMIDPSVVLAASATGLNYGFYESFVYGALTAPGTLIDAVLGTVFAPVLWVKG